MSEPAAVTVNGVAAQMGLNGLDFAATIPVTTGPNILSVTAMETQASSPGLNLQSTTGSVSINIADETRRTLTYDANGSTATDSLGRAYEWDRANRLKAIAYSGPGSKRTEFSYDSSSRWNRIVERDNGVITSDKRFLWDGFKIAEERDAAGTVTKRYYPEGLQDVTASQNSFYGSTTSAASAPSPTPPAPCKPVFNSTPGAAATKASSMVSPQASPANFTIYIKTDFPLPPTATQSSLRHFADTRAALVDGFLVIRLKS